MGKGKDKRNKTSLSSGQLTDGHRPKTAAQNPQNLTAGRTRKGHAPLRECGRKRVGAAFDQYFATGADTDQAIISQFYRAAKDGVGVVSDLGGDFFTDAADV
jgi:hypothetical protein